MSLAEVQKKMEFIGGQYLDSTAFPEDGIDLTIRSIQTEQVENLKTFKKEPKKIIYFEELELGMVLNAKCSKKMLLDLAGGDQSRFKGLRVNMYRDPTVKFGKNVTGGLRFRKAKTAAEKKGLTIDERRQKTLELIAKAGIKITGDHIDAVNSCESPEQLKAVFEALTTKTTEEQKA